MKTIILPLLTTEKDIKKLNYPQDLSPGMYVWDNDLNDAILITDLTSVELHKNHRGSRTRFATKREVLIQREEEKFPHVKYNTVTKLRAYNYAYVIYNF